MPISADATLLRRLWSRYFSGDPAVVWDIGSRDGLDGLVLAEAFKASSVLCFEPNPDTWDQLRANIARHPRVRASNLALADADGGLTFYRIDRAKTLTTWPDGNPGASSLFPASNDYTIERYVQIPTLVSGARARSLIAGGEVPPSLVWMDVQGAELEVLKGFDEYLDRVGLLYVELSLLPIYEGQALASEVIRYLRSRGFFWCAVPNPGHWQFDAVFVRTSRMTIELVLRDLCYRLAMHLPWRPGVSRALPGPKALSRAVKATASAVATRIATALLAHSPTRVIRWATTSLLWSPMPRPLRIAIEQSRPLDPLRLGHQATGSLESIDVLVPSAGKDLWLAAIALESAARASVNEVASARLVVPRACLREAADLARGRGEVVGEEHFLPAAVLREIERMVPPHRQGWVLQQTLKLLAVVESQRPVLVVDGDTLLLRRRTWYSNGRQLLLPVHEFHRPYEAHFRAIVTTPRRAALSWVAHHQLMQPDLVREWLSGLGAGDMVRGIIEWLKAGCFDDDSAISEYHSYARYLLLRHPSRASLGRWGNVRMSEQEMKTMIASSGSNEELIAALSERVPAALSVSVHSWAS